MEEQTKFTIYLGNSPTIRILDYLITYRELEYSLSDIARNSGVGWTTLHRIWDNLVKTGMVKYTRNIGMAKLFKLNTENRLVQKLIALHEFILDLELPVEKKKKLKQKVLIGV